MNYKEKYKQANATPWNIVLNTLCIESVQNKVICPFHNDSRPSYHLYDTHGHCFACGKTSSKIDFVKKYTGKDTKEAVQLILGNHTIPNQPKKIPKKKEVDTRKVEKV